MSETEFKISLRKWLKHKMVLAQKSRYYTSGLVKAKTVKIGEVFHQFITNGLPYTAHQLSALVVKYEDILWGIIPNEHNPSYQKSIESLNELIETAKKLMSQ